MVLISLVYVLTANRNLRLNKDYNDQMETLVATIETRKRGPMQTFMTGIMKTNIHLSDLEVFNYSIVTVISMGVFVLSMLFIVDEGPLVYGTVFSILMYIFEFVEKVIVLPMYYQYYLRLSEISHRLSQTE